MQKLNYLLIAVFLALAVFAPDIFAHMNTADMAIAGGLLIGNTQMTPGQARVVDPVLSSIAHGYKNPDVSRIGRVFFPRVAIPVRGAKIIRFGKEAFKLYNARRAPGAATKRVQFGYADGSVSLVQESLEGTVPVELMDEALAVPGVDLARGAVENVQEIFDRAEEYEQISVLTNANNYDVNHKIDLGAGSQWDEAAPKIGKQIRDYKEAIRASTGRYPNKMGLSPDVFNALAESAEIQERFKYTNSDSITTAMLAAYFNIQDVVVGNDVYIDENAAADADFTDMMSNVAVLAFVPSAGRYNVPSYGYTYHLPGHPMVEKPYYEQNNRSWMYPQTYERQVVHSGAGAGFLITNVLGGQ